MRLVDWRTVPAALLAPLYEAGQRQWLATLGWDRSTDWRAIEHARTTWGLPGLLAVDDHDTVCGWTFVMSDRETLHVGVLCADRPEATEVLVDAVVEMSSACGAARLSTFLFRDAPDVLDVLQHRGFDIEEYLYLAREHGPAGPRLVGGHVPAATAWEPHDVTAAASLLREAYGRQGRHFAPGLTTEEWERYVHNLVEQTACGTLDAAASRVVRGDAGLDALVLVTRISADTAHVPQVVVRPGLRRRGLAGCLLRDAMALAAECGVVRTTLLVAATNIAARHLYAGLGFRGSARFVAGQRAA